MSQPRKDRTHTSFPEKVKRHKVQHGVLDVVNLFFQWELQREKGHYEIEYVLLLVFSQIKQCTENKGNVTKWTIVSGWHSSLPLPS